MWLDQADGLSEIFRGYLPYYLLVFFPIFIILSPVNPVEASHEFSVYRMQQYDLHSVPHGCRSASFNLEGRSLSSWGTSRHCVVARIQDISVEQIYEIRNKAGALLLVLPLNETLLSNDAKEHIRFVEAALTQQEMNIPVYFAEWSPDIEYIIHNLQHSIITDDKSGSALEAMMNTVSSNGYQIVVSAPTPQKIDSKPVTLHGKLIGRSTSAQTIVVAAQYDAAGAVPELAFGADSNASGAVALLELARIFSRLYSTAAVRAAPSILFVLSSTGHSLNYFATKKWLEDQLDSADASLLQDISFVMCLDSISSGPLSMHVSKPPKPGSPAHSVKARLGVDVVHKKINLADELLAWHHERFSIRRMTAFTVSALKSHKEPARSSVLDTPSEAGLRRLVTNIQSIARALASHVYNLTDEGGDEDSALYDNALNVDETFIRTWYNYLASTPRAPQVIAVTPNTAGVTGALERALSQFVSVSVSAHAPDRREPDHVLYTPTRALLHVYSVKPAVFDLLLTLVIVTYLTVLYFAMQIFPRFYEEYFKLVTGKVKVN